LLQITTKFLERNLRTFSQSLNAEFSHDTVLGNIKKGFLRSSNDLLRPCSNALLKSIKSKLAAFVGCKVSDVLEEDDVPGICGPGPCRFAIRRLKPLHHTL
jgi:hypothetical protein